MTASAAAVPLTEAQLGLWYAQRLDRLNPLFNTAQYVEIDGPLDIDRFREAVDMALGEADALALALDDSAAAVTQRIDPSRRPRLEIVDLSGDSDPRETALALLAADAATAIDPVVDAMARGILYILGPQRVIWYQRIHHLAIDGYGTMLLERRIAALYDRGPADGEPLAPLSRAFEEDQAYRLSESHSADAAYWRAALADMPEVVGMAPGRAVSAERFHRVRVALDAAQVGSLEALSARTAMSWPDVLTALVGAYCQRFVSAGEIVLGVPHMGRFGSAAARVPAMVMNVLPLRLSAGADRPLADYLSSCAQDLAAGRRHGRYRGEQIRRDLGLIGGRRRLYGPLVNILPFDRPLTLAGLATRTTILSTGPVDDLTFTFRGDLRRGLTLELDANPLLYEPEDTGDHARRLLAFIGNAGTAETLGDIPTVPDAEAADLVAGSEGPSRALPETTLAALLAGQMAATPDAIALSFGPSSLTYAELDRRSAALAHHLRRLGVGREAIVAVALPRSLDLVVALVAILRAGGAYMPLDPAHPPQRLAGIVATARPVLAIAAPGTAGNLPAELPVLTPSDWPSSGAAPSDQAGPDDAAYVIFTSGSTGAPKGVVVEHRAIVNRLLWMVEHYGFDADDRVLQKTPATFDVSVWEFFLPLIVGATLVVAAPDAHRDPAAIAALIRQQAITTLHFVPSMLSAFLSEPAAKGLALRRVFSSGEELTADQRDRFHATLSAELHNLYGPTEAAVDVSYWNAHAGDGSMPVPIGFPVWNTRLYVLDDRRRPVPPGVEGDLYLGGVQLARGYLGRPDLTGERFLPDPFRSGERIYMTGDRARRRRDGAVVYLGRTDQQIKLRGLRIELAEIEAAALATGLVTQIAVLLREDQPGQRRLVAYVMPAPAFTEADFRLRLQASLPDYMVPAAIVAMRDLPLTANGKLDRAALPAPDWSQPPSRLPGSDTERLLARLYSDVLDLAEAPGADADFFALGGDSLAAVGLLLGIREALGHDPGLAAVFANPTIAALAAAMDGADAELASGLGPLIRLASGHPAASPLFLVHPAGGLAWCYRGLADALGSSRDIYGLQSPALDADYPMPDSIEALAADYVDRVLALETPGPVHLAGWSVGGLIAQEMAVRLEQIGRPVGLVAMLDSYPAECWRAEPEPDAMAALRALLAIAGYDATAHPELDSRAAIVAFLRQGSSPLAGLPETALDGVVRLVTDTNRLVRGHRHRHFSGTLTHVRAALDHQGRPLHPALWAPYAGRLDTVDVPCLHAQLTGPAATARIAPEFAARLDAIDGV